MVNPFKAIWCAFKGHLFAPHYTSLGSLHLCDRCGRELTGWISLGG